MKRILLQSAVFLALANYSNAQNIGKNMAKVNLSSFAFKGYSAQYERQISRRFTAAISYSSIPYGRVAFQSVIENFAKDSEVQVGQFRLGTSVITPEIRYYISRRGAFRGFYIAPYARISAYDMQVPVSFGTIASKRTAMFSGKINNTTGGLMLGSQFKLSNKIYLDWWILGASIGSAEGKLVAETTLNTLEQQEIRNQINSIDIPFTKIKSEVNSNGATVSTTGSMLGARGLGFNLGFRF